MRFFRRKRDFAQITSTIRKTVVELRELSVRCTDKADQLNAEAVRLRYEANAAENEALEATLAADKIEALIK
ncbi:MULTISPECIES: hypothetical protein [unclassified Aminobacter]|uniref:hypothetical protein n=1 Tax=unclassified Aminobacter TaxID=2644704 RepID=UPI00046320E5|nr:MULTISPECIES: hypothetical protein [unclassified Aminobacter]TWH35570.1 hypothetical protein L611_001200000510 [Aminobacter sp. J15]